MYNRYAKELKQKTDNRERQLLREPAHSQVLERWRKFGFTDNMPEELSELEFYMASSFEMIAIYLLNLDDSEYPPRVWEDAFLPLLKRVLLNFWHSHKKACRPIEPEEIISFLQEKNIYDLLKFMVSKDGKNRSRYRRQTFEEIVYIIRNYCEENGFNYSLLEAFVRLTKSDDGEKFGNIFFPGDYRDAVFIEYVADYFTHELYEFDKLYNNRRKRNKNHF